MQILFVVPELPQPPFTGVYSRPFTLLQAAAAHHDVVLVGGAPEDADLDALRELCDELHVAPLAAAQAARRRGFAAGRRALTPVPLVSAGRLPVVAALVDEAVARRTPGAMFLETLYAAHYRVPGIPAMVDLPEIPSGLCESAAAARPVRYLAANLQAATSRRYERRLLRDTLPVTINDGDRERLATLGVEAYCVPLAVDLAPEEVVIARGSRARHDEAVRLLFVGSFSHASNCEAARWLIDRLAPQLRSERVPFAMVIAGRHAPHWLRKAAGAGVTVVSDAPDLAPLYASAEIVLAPLPLGGGAKHKTLEAMAWGLPVIGTPQAFSGLPQLDGKAFIVDPLDPVPVTRRIEALRDDPEWRLDLGLAARAYISEAHSPAAVRARAAALFDAVAAGGGVAEAETLSRG